MNIEEAKNKRSDDVLGTIAIDSIFNPILNVSWDVQPIATSTEGHEKLIMEIKQSNLYEYHFVDNLWIT